MDDIEHAEPNAAKNNRLLNLMFKEEEEQAQKDFLKRSKEAAVLLRQKEKEASEVQERLAKRERELEQFREQIVAEQHVREKMLHRENESRQAAFAEREQTFMRRQSGFEKLLAQREQEVELLRSRLNDEISQREASLHDAHLALQQEKERYNQENRERLDRTSKKYVVEALESLQLQETKFHKMSESWSRGGAGALVVGLVFFAAITLSSLNTLPVVVTWEVIVFSVVKGLIAVSLLGALARYAFLLSNSYVREALKNADRRHAINFGKFYLESYGAAADWSQVKEAFEHWNISGPNAFSQSDQMQVDAPSLGKISASIEQIVKLLPKLKASESV